MSTLIASSTNPTPFSSMKSNFSFKWNDGSAALIWVDSTLQIHLTLFSINGAVKLSDQILFTSYQGNIAAIQNNLTGDIYIGSIEQLSNPSKYYEQYHYVHLVKNAVSWTIGTNMQFDPNTNVQIKSWTIGTDGEQPNPNVYFYIEYFNVAWNGTTATPYGNLGSFVVWSSNDFASFNTRFVMPAVQSVTPANWDAPALIPTTGDGHVVFLYSKYNDWIAFGYPENAFWHFTPPGSSTLPVAAYDAIQLPDGQHLVGFQGGANSISGNIVYSHYIANIGWSTLLTIDNSGNAQDPVFGYDGANLYVTWVQPHTGGGKQIVSQQIVNGALIGSPIIQYNSDTNTNRYPSTQKTGSSPIELYFNDLTGNKIQQVLNGYNLAPFAPNTIQIQNSTTGTSGLAVGTQTPTFSWVFSDPNGYDTQSAFEVVIVNASTGVTFYDSGKIVSSSQNYTLPNANALTYGTNYQVKVSTWDSSNTQGAYSSLIGFKPSQPPTATLNEPPSATVTAPVLAGSTTGGTIPSSTVYVRYTTLLNGFESQASAESSVAVTGTTASVTVTLPTPPAGASYNVYAGSSSNAELLSGNTQSTSYVISVIPTSSNAYPTFSIAYNQIPTFSWVYGGASSQAQFQVIVQQSGGTVFDSGVQSSAQNNFQIPSGYLSNNGQYTIYVYVWSNDGIESVLTSVSQATFNVFFAAPPIPTLQCTVNNGNGTIAITVTNQIPIGNQIDTQFNDLYRIDNLGIQFKIQSSMQRNSTFVDYSCGNNQQYTYFAIGNAANGVTSRSLPISGVLNIQYPANAFLVPISNPFAQIPCTILEDQTPKYTLNTVNTTYIPIGGAKPIGRQLADMIYTKGTITFTLLDKYNGWNQLQALIGLMNNQAFYWKDYYGNLFFIQIDSGLQIDRKPRIGYIISFNFTEISP